MTSDCHRCHTPITDDNALVVALNADRPPHLSVSEFHGSTPVCQPCAGALMLLWRTERYVAALTGRGYPERHVRMAEGYNGLGVRAARAILPHIDAGGIVAVCGDRGRGKTGLAVFIARERWLAGRKVGTFVTATEMFLEVRATFAKNSGRTEKQVVEGYIGSDLLVIDELHERRDTDFENLVFVEILNKRYARMKPTLLLSNGGRASLAASLGASIVDRIAETGVLLECTENGRPWPSYRHTETPQPQPELT